MKAIASTDWGIPDLTGQGTKVTNQAVEFCAVLTKDDAGLHAVYTGIVPSGLDTEQKRRRVMHNGQKLAYRKAVIFFADLTEAEYRR